MITLESFVTGIWHAGTGAHQTLYDPSTEAPLAQCNSEGIDFFGVLQYARELGGPALRKRTFGERAELLGSVSALWHEHREELLDLSVQNGGNTRGDAKFDVDGAIGTLAAYARLGKELGDRRALPDGEGVQLGRTARFWGQHVRVPRPGAAVHINAFNFPAWGMGEKLACALLAGVPVITKPGTPTALLAWRMAKLLVESGILPEGAFQFVAGGTGDLLDHLGPQDALAFTGSSRTGAALRARESLLAQNVRVNVEADSLNAAILGADVDPSSETYGLFLQNVVLDMTQKAGQKCTAVRRVLVPAERVQEVAADLSEALRRVVVGHPAERATGMGPLTSSAALEGVREGIRKLASAGAVVCGGAEPVHEKGFFVAPTLVLARDPGAEVFHRDEVFGPVASVLAYSGKAADAAALANEGGGSLVASAYSNDKAWSEELVLAIAPWHGRVWIGSDRVAAQSFPPGMVMPQMVHGGPGRAGGGEELGGLRGLDLYLQRTALQGFQGFLAPAFGPAGAEPGS